MKFINGFTTRTFQAGVGVALMMTVACSNKDKVSLETVTVQNGDITEIVTATGTLESITSVDVGTQVTGIVSKLYADYNSHVTKGQVIAEIDKTTLESDLKSANASLESSRVSYNYAKTNYERDKTLHEKNLISNYDFESSQKEYLVAKSVYERAQADRVKAAKNLSYAEIYSPIDGIVVSREVEVGQTVVSNMSVANLYTIADLNKMQVVADVDEADIGSVKVGQSVSFTVDAFPNDKFMGQVTQVRISPKVTSNVVTYEVLISAPNPQLKLIPGLTANVTINVKELRDVLVIPLKTLRFVPQEFEAGGEDLPSFTLPETMKDMKHGNAKEQGGTPKDPAIPTDDMHRLVWVLRDNKLVATEVLLGDDNGVNVAVLSGLKDGDKVAEQYAESSIGDDESSSSDQGSSPFMPKHPGSEKKKSASK